MAEVAPTGRGHRRPARGRRLALTVVAWVVVALLVLATCFAVWAHVVMPGTRSAALAVWRDDRVQVRDTGDAVVMEPAGGRNGVGVVFVPGAKVDPYAYLATFHEAVVHGTTVVITKPTLNLAFFDTRPLSTFQAHAPLVRTWAVGGHSLGGVRACQLAASGEVGTSYPAVPAVSGLLLLGSYCANDLSRSDLDVLSIAGSRDGLSTPAKVQAARHLLPADARMPTIDGANHASFGHYGAQPGDLDRTVPRSVVDRQIDRAVERWAAGLAAQSLS